MQEPKFAPHLSGYRNVPFAGVFVSEEILLAQEQLVRTIDADWIVLVTPDEILHSNVPGETLASAIEKMDARGYNVINFDEFHFLPVDYDYIPDGSGANFIKCMFLSGE